MRHYKIKILMISQIYFSLYQTCVLSFSSSFFLRLITTFFEMLKFYSLLIFCVFGGCLGQKNFVVHNKDTLSDAVQKGDLILIFTRDLT